MKGNVNMKDTVYKIFADLQRKEIVNKDSFLVASLPFTQKHKIGISIERYPMFFIKCSNTTHSLDIKLEFITVLFNRTCRLSEGKKQSENIYTIISLKTEDMDIQRYFLEVVCIILEQLPENISHKQLKMEIQKLIELFSHLSRPSLKTIQGIWAELFIIERSKHPEYLIQSWHTSSNDKFDFNDGQDKIEVKSTSTIRRVHNFALEQLMPNKNSNLLIGSVFAVHTGEGKSIIDLINSICERVQNLQLQFRLNEIVTQTLGSDFNKIFDIYFDYQQAIDTLAFFDYKSIPVIDNENIPKEVSNVRMDCDLSHVAAIKNKDLNESLSTLFRSI